MYRNNRNSGRKTGHHNTGSRASEGDSRWGNQNDDQGFYRTPTQRSNDRNESGNKYYGDYGYATSSHTHYRDADEYNESLHYGNESEPHHYENYDDGQYYENDSYYMGMPGRWQENYHDAHERWEDAEQSYDDDLYPDDYYNGYENAYGHQHSDDYGHSDITHENYHYYYDSPTRRKRNRNNFNHGSNRGY